MKKILSLAVLGLAGFACAANCLDVVNQIHLAESELFTLGGDVLDSLHMQSGSSSFANRKFQWDGNYISLISTTRSGGEGGTISTTTSILFVSNEGDVSTSGISILSLKEEKDNQTVFFNIRYEQGTVVGEHHVTVDEKSLTIEYTPRSELITTYDKLEYTRSNDTLYSRGWKNRGSEENKLVLNRYIVADKDFKNCSEWNAYASGESPKQEYTLEIIDTESGYVLRKTEYGVEDSKYLQEYFFTVLKDESSTDAPDVPSVDTPDVPAEETPDVSAEETPDVPAEETPDVPDEETPDVPAEETPDVPDVETPDKPADETTDKPVSDPSKDTSTNDATAAPQESEETPKDTSSTPNDTTLAIAKQMKAVPVLKSRDHYIDLKGRSFSKQKMQLPYRVLF